MLLLLSACSVVGSSLDHFAAGCTGDECEECLPPQQICDGVCVDTSNNQQNCGSCGTSCGAGEACVAGVCKIACPGGQVECGGLCYDLQNEPKHCGKCELACGAGEVCGNGTCLSTCPTGQDNCNGSCANLQTDPKHCGVCGKACAANEECVAGTCAIACKTLLNQPIEDPWGFSWDGLERAASTYAEARDTCESINGRLPTASELHRVSATQSATVGQTIHTNYLWSIVPYDTDTHMRLRLSDSTTSPTADANVTNYRCVCPPPLPDAYVGGNCYGNVGQGCFGLETDGKRYNLDVKDRAQLSKGAAIWECTFYRGHLASPQQLTHAILQNIGSGTGAWLHTADDVHYAYDAVLSWSDPSSFVFQYTGSTNALSWSSTQELRPFRCVGTKDNPGPHPAAISGEYVGPRSSYKGESNDNESAGWAAAHDACFAKGGHLSYSTELGELIGQGLPNGTGTWLSTADQLGWNQVQFLSAVKRWTDTDPMHWYGHDKDLSWVDRASSNPYRCIYYPIDTAYTGPAAADCAGSCFTLDLPGTSGAKMWLDASDRTPAATALGAIDACRKLGGRLPSERDLTEAIRKGLPNGTTSQIWTSDLQYGDGANVALLVGLVYWNGTDTSFDDQYSMYSTWGFPHETRAYRCMWTNELR